MRGGALPDKRAPRHSHGPSGSKGPLRPRFWGPTFVAPLIVARLLGEGGFLGHLLQITFVVGLISVVRSLSHCVLWEWELHRKSPEDPEKRRRLRRWMVLELLVAIAGVGLSYMLQAADLASTSCGPVPLPLVLLFAFAAGTIPTVLRASEHAERAGLRPTSNALRDYLGEREVPETISRAADWPVWGSVYAWLTARLAPNQASGVAVFLITIPLLIFAEGSYAIYSSRAEHALERTVIEYANELRSELDGKSEGSEREDRGSVIVSSTASSASLAGSKPAPEDRSETCGFEPGIPAPEPWVDDLYGLWYGSEQTEGAGNVAAGCPRPAEVEVGQPRVWLERGLCNGVLQGLGVAAPDYGPPAMLFQKAASIGSAFAREGALLGASPRTRVGAGDLYAFETPRGTYVAIRSRRTYGPTGAGTSAAECGEFSDRNVPYELVPPGLLGIWSTIASHGWAWPVADGGDASHRHFSFLADLTGNPVGQADCTGELSCEGSFRGRPLAALDVTTVSAEMLAALGP
jgi:hypothetical protein